MSFVKDAWDAVTGKTAAKGAEKASAQQMAFQQQGLDYLMETEELPQELRQGALSTLGGLYGLEGGTGSQDELIEQAMKDPLYAAILGTGEAGEEAIMRSAGATGGLRSGNIQGALYDYNQRLNERALLNSYDRQLQGLGALAQQPSQAANIANLTAGIGETQAAGTTAAAQSKQEGWGNIIGTGLSIAGSKGWI